MFNVIKNVILGGNYKLSEVQYKIKKMYMTGDITEAQMDELFMLASNKVSVDAERPEIIEMLRNLSDRLYVLECRVGIVEEEDSSEATEEIEYSAWKQWDGISNYYQKNAIVSHNEELWISVFDGQNVWEPGTAGTESLWVKYVPEE